MDRSMKDPLMEQQQRRRALVPAFGGWDDMAACGASALPDYSLDFSRIRAARMQRRKALSWSSGAGAVNSSSSIGEEELRSPTNTAPPANNNGGGSERLPRRRHRRQHSDTAEARQPIRASPIPKEGRSKFKGYFFGCMGRWNVEQH